MVGVPPPIGVGQFVLSLIARVPILISYLGASMHANTGIMHVNSLAAQRARQRKEQATVEVAGHIEWGRRSVRPFQLWFLAWTERWNVRQCATPRAAFHFPS